MKKSVTYILLGFIVLSSLSSCAHRRAKMTFRDESANHRLVAVMPMDVKFEENPRNIRRGEEELTEIELKKLQADYGRIFQERAEAFLRYRGISVRIQGAKETRAILKANNITRSVVRDMSITELATILGVDGIVFGEVFLDQPFSEKAAFGIGVAQTIETAIFGTRTGGTPTTNRAIGFFEIYDGDTGGNIWSVRGHAGFGLGSSPEGVADALIARSMRRIPYRRR